MCVRVLFSADDRYENHVGLAIQDKYGAIRSATGSIPLGIAGVRSGQARIFELDIALMIEASDYSLMVNLGYAIEKNRGVVLDEARDIGPIRVTWDYENEIAPFLGQVGLPNEGRYLDPHEIDQPGGYEVHA